MTAETYKYFKPDTTNLRADYGGGLILDNGDSAEPDAITLTQRYVCRELGLPTKGTHYLFQAGNDGTDDWLRVSDNLYSSISSFLTAKELASVVSSEPASFVESSRIPYFQPKVRRKNLIVIGDSLSSGVSSTEGLPDAPSKQALDLIQSTTELALEPSERCWENDTWSLCNLSLGSSSWANTDAAGGIAVYPNRFDLAFNQRFRPLALNGTETTYLHVWLGTNDLAYDTDLTGAQAWARAVTAIGQLKAEFPSTPIILGTCIRRSELAALNDRLDDYNILMRAEYLTAGADYLVDYETAHVSFNVNTGNSQDLTVYAGDEVHNTTAGYAAQAVLLEALMSTLGVAPGSAPTAVELDAPAISGYTTHAAYGFSRLVDGYAGNTVRLSRASDAAESDFGLTSTGSLDTNAVDAWRAGSDASLVHMIDQKGSGVTLDVFTEGTVIVSNKWHKFGTTINQRPYSGSKTSGTAIISSITSTTDMRVGMIVNGSGVTADNYIVSVDSATQITLKNNNTATETSSFTVENGQLDRDPLSGGVGVDFGSESGYMKTSTNLTIDSTSGLEFHMIWSHNERKAHVDGDALGSNDDVEYMFSYGESANDYIKAAVGEGSSNDYLRVNTNTSNSTADGFSGTTKQYGQNIASYVFTGTTLGAYMRGGKPLEANLVAGTQTDIAAGRLDDQTLLIGNSFTGSGGAVRTDSHLNGIFGGIIVTAPLTDGQRFLLQAKLNVIGQEHRAKSLATVLGYFDEVVLSKNVNPVTGVLVGENSLLTLNHNVSVVAEGTPDWDFEYTQANVGLQGIRSPTDNDANGFIASDTYFAGTTKGTVMALYYSESSSNDLPVAYTQTNGTGFDNDLSRSFSLGFDHSTVSFETKVANARDDDDIIGTRLKADETSFGYDMANQSQSKYNGKTSHEDFTYDETYDSETWTAARWRNETGVYDLDGKVITHTPDNLQYGEKDGSLILQIGTFKAPDAYDWSANYATRKPLMLQGDSKSYVSDGIAPIFHRDGVYAHNREVGVVDSTATSKIGSENAAAPLPTFVGSRYMIALSGDVFTDQKVEETQVNLYKILES